MRCRVAVGKDRPKRKSAKDPTIWFITMWATPYHASSLRPGAQTVYYGKWDSFKAKQFSTASSAHAHGPHLSGATLKIPQLALGSQERKSSALNAWMRVVHICRFTPSPSVQIQESCRCISERARPSAIMYCIPNVDTRKRASSIDNACMS